MKTVFILSALCISVSCLPAAITITPADIQEDENGYYYEYELTYADMLATSQIFQQDVDSSSNVAVYGPSIRTDRYIYPLAGQREASFEYVFDFSDMVFSPDGTTDYGLIIRAVYLDDKFVMANNAGSTEDSTAESAWSVDNANYTTINSAATPASGSQAFIHSGFIMSDFSRKFYYNVNFTNAKTDPDGFDQGLSQWNTQSNTDTDYFRVKFFLSLVSPPGTYAGGDGSESSPYQIATPDQLESVGGYPFELQRHFELIADIDMTGRTYDKALIAYNESIYELFEGTEFSGSFNGNGHKITGLRFDGGTTGTNIGLFGRMSTAEVRDLILEDVQVKGESRLGCLAGQSAATITNCSVEGFVSGKDSLGVFVGINWFGTIIGCSASGTCNGKGMFGGFTGSSYYGTITDCSFKGAVNGSISFGGFASSFYRADISGCSCDVDIVAAQFSELGGFVNNINESQVYNCAARGSIYSIDSNDPATIGGFSGSAINGSGVSYCYAANTIRLDSGYSGVVNGFTGYDDSSDPNPSTFTGCFWDSDLSVETGARTGITGLPTATLKVKGLFTSYGWDFVGETVNGTNDVWNIIENVTYPRFAYECIAPPAGDINGDCVFDLFDFAASAEGWLDCGIITPELCP
jgi:hypothetical protein